MNIWLFISTMKTYKDLNIWEFSAQLTKRFPVSDKLYFLYMDLYNQHEN